MGKSIYIHIPFCKEICTYCDFPKLLCNDKWYDKYLSSLVKEIRTRYQKEKITTLYIGGGTPSSLPLKYLERVLSLSKMFKLSKDIEFTLECNILDITYEKTLLMKKYGVNRVSLGVQTLNSRLLTVLGRYHTFEDLKNAVSILKQNDINNINFDLIYAIPGQTINDLKQDLDQMISLKPTHVSAYSLIIEPHTSLYINNFKPIDEDLDRSMYDYIRIYLKGRNIRQYEISNYANKGFMSQHNLTYWYNQDYYGFGLGAVSYLDKTRISNTKNFNSYVQGEYQINSTQLSENEIMSYTMILGLRTRMGVNKDWFYQQYGKQIADVFDVSALEEDEANYRIKDEDVYTSNNILEKFLL